MEQLADSDSPGRDNLAVAVVAHRQAQHSLVAGEVKLLGVGGSHQQGDDSDDFRLVLDVLNFLGDSQYFDVL